MDDGRKILPFDAQRLYPMPPAAFNDVRLTSGGQSGACTDLLGRPSPLTPVDFMATLQGPYNYMVSPHGWGIAASYLGPQQQKHSSGHPIHHQQRIGGNLSLGTSAIYPDALNPFYGVPQRNLWGPCFSNQLDPAILASYWLQQQQHHHQQQQQQQQHHQQQQQQLSQHFSSHLQPPRCDIDDCRRERRHRDRRPKSALPNRPGEEECEEEEGTESGRRKVVETSEKRPNRSQRSLSRNRTNNNNKSGYQDNANASPSNGGRCRLRRDIKEDVDDDVAIVAVEGGASVASTVTQQRLKLEAAAVAVAKVPSSLATTTTTRISASPDTTTLTSSFLGSASSAKVSDVTNDAQKTTTTTFDDVKSELDLGYHHYHDLGDHPSSPPPPHHHHNRLLAPTQFKTEPENQFRGSKNSLSSKNSFGSNFRISDIIAVDAVAASSPTLRNVKVEGRDRADSGGFKNDKSLIPSPTDSKPFIHDLQSQLGVPGFESLPEVMDFSSGCRSQSGFASADLDRSSVGAIKCEENVASTTVAVTSSTSPAAAAAAASFDVKVEEVGLSPRESKQHRSSLLSDLEKNLGSFHKSQKLSLEMPDSVSCVSLSCHMGEYRVSHQKSGHRVGKVFAPTYLPEIGQPDMLSTTQNGSTTTTTTTLSVSSASSALVSSLSAADVLCTGVGVRRPTTKKRKKSSSSSSSSSPRIASSSPSLSPVAKSIAQRTAIIGSGVKREIVAAGILGDVHLKLESSTEPHEAGSNPAPRHDSSSPFGRTADGSTLLTDDIPCCYRPDHVGVLDCTDVECRSPFEARQLACHQPLVGLSGCLSSRPGRMAGHCAKSFSTANSPSVPVGVARALQRSCNSGGGGCWRGSSSLSSPACSNHHLVRCSMETKDHALLQANPNSGEESIFLNRTTPPHQSSSSSSSSSLLNPSGYKSSFSSHNLFHPQNPHAPPPHCSLEHRNNFHGGLLHGDHPHMDNGDDDVVGSCDSRGKDVHSDLEVVSLVPGKASRSEEQDGFSPLDLTKNKERVNSEAEASATVDASAASESLPLASSKSMAGESCVTSHSLNSGKFCLCCCPCCCLFKSRILSKACSHLFASPSSSSPSLQASLATTASLRPNQSNDKIVSTESRATSPMEWSPPFQPSDFGKTLRDSETQTDPAPKNSIPSLANPFQVAPPTHQSFLASSSSTLSYTDAEDMRTSVDGADEVFDFGGLSILSSVAEAAGQLPRATPATGRLSILDIPVSVFMELPETPPAVECQRTPPAELPPSPDLTLNYNVPRSNVFFRSSAADGDNRPQQLQRHFNDSLSSNNGEMTTVMETAGVAGEMLDNELYLRKKLEEVKCLYQQNKKEVAKLERLSSQKAKNKKQRKDHPATSTASASTTTATSSTVAKSRHVPGHKVSTNNSSSRYETVATTSTTLATQTPVASESLTATVCSSASLLRVSLSSLTSSATPSPVVTPTAPILTSASLDPVQVKGGGSDEPPKLSFSGVVSSCGGVEAQVKLEKEDHVVEGHGEVGIGSVSKPPKKKRKNSNGSSTGKENHRGRSASDVKSEENEASDPERDWLFRRRSERIFLHQPFMNPAGKVKEETQPMSEDTPLDKDHKSADESDLGFHDIKTLPLSPLSLPPVPITEDNNNTFIKDIYNNNNNVERTDALFHNKLPVSSALPILIGSLNSPPEFSSNAQPKDDIQTIEMPKVELEMNSDPTKVKNEDLVDGLKVLYLREQCFVEATVRNISPPDIYGVVVDRDRSRRPDILSLEELLSKIVRVVQPSSRDQLPTGSRVCVLWSGRSNSFYPGTVLEDEDEEEEDGLDGGKNEALHDSAEKRSTSGGNKDVQLNIDFDDGDSGWFPLEQIRMLPSNFPIQKVEMSLDSVLAASRKKRSSSSQAEYGAPQKISKKRSEGDVATSKTSKNHEDLAEHPLPKEVHKAPREESRQQKAKVKDSRPMNPASIPSEKLDQRAKNSQLLEKFHEKMTKVKRDVSSGIDAFKKKENKQNLDTSKKKEQSPAKIIFEERHVFKLEKKGSAESSTGTKQKFEQKKDSHSQRGSHFQNIFEEMKKLKSEERAPKSLRDPSNRPLPSTESNPEKDPSFFSCPRKDVERANKKESTGGAKQPENDKNMKKQSKKARKTSKKESGSSGNEGCTSDGTSGSIRKKRKQSVSSCSEPGCPEKSNKLPIVPQNPHPVSAAAQVTTVVVTANATAITTVSGPDSIPSPAAKCKRSFSPEKYEEAVEVPTWQWYGAGVKRQGIKGKSRKTFYKAIKRGNEIVEVGNSVVFLSNGKSKFKFVGCVESFWENPDGSKSVKVKWYYHPEETRGGANQIQFTWRALFQSSHEDENDLQTISHKCQILSFKDFKNLLSTTTTTDNNKSPFKQSSAAQQSSLTSSPFLPSVPTATPSFSITPFTSNLSTLKQNSSIRGGYLAGSGSASGSGPMIVPGGCNLPCEVYYLAGTYEPTRNYIWFEPGVPLLKDRDRFLVPGTAMSSALPLVATSNIGNTNNNGDDDSVGKH